MTLFGIRIPMMASLLLWCVAWEIVGRSGVLMLVPPFSGVLASLGELLSSGKF